MACENKLRTPNVQPVRLSYRPAISFTFGRKPLYTTTVCGLFNMTDSSSAGASGAMPQLPPHTEWYQHSRAVWPVALAIFFEAFAITAVALRIWSLRLSRKQKLADHDWVILVALVCSLPGVRL